MRLAFGGQYEDCKAAEALVESPVGYPSGPSDGRSRLCVCVCVWARASARPVCVCRFPRMSVFCPWTTYPLGYPSGPGTCPACPLGPYARCKRGDYRQPSSTPSRHSSMSSSTPCQPYPRSPSLASPALPFPPPHYPPRPHTAPLCAHPPHPPPPSWSGSLRAGRRSTAAHCWSTASQAQAGAPVTRRPGPWVICCCPCRRRHWPRNRRLSWPVPRAWLPSPGLT